MGRYTRHEEVPAYETRIDRIEAVRYNRVRLALTRLGPDLRLPLNGMGQFEMILQDDAWVCVDRNLSDLPILAWSHFRRPDALHEPVPCQLRYYHVYGSAIRAKALERMDRELEARLHPERHPEFPTP